jgi:bacterioferritin-associated ferredoxin
MLRIHDLMGFALYLCICNAITERQVRETAQAGARSVDDLASALGLGAGCGRCRECAAALLKELKENSFPIRLSPSAS